jgi:hypothetical protein
MFGRTWLPLSLCALYFAALSHPASAQGETEGSAPLHRASPADDWINRGTELRKQGDDRRALAAFQQAWAIDHSPRALAQAALAEQALGSWLDADRHLREALQAPDDVWIQKHRATLEAALRQIASQLGSVEIACNLAGAEVRIDGVLVGRTPLDAPVRWVAGQSVIQVASPGYFTAARALQVDAGGLSRVNFTLIAEPAAGKSGPREILMYGSLGFAALGVATGVTGYWVREINVRAYNDDTRCARQPGPPRSSECPKEAAAWRTGEALAVAGFSAAGVFGALGLYLWLKQPAAPGEHDFACNAGAWSFNCGGRF